MPKHNKVSFSGRTRRQGDQGTSDGELADAEVGNEESRAWLKSRLVSLKEVEVIELVLLGVRH